MLPRHRTALAAVPLLLLTGCSTGDPADEASAAAAGTTATAAGVPTGGDEAAGPAATDPTDEAADEAAGEEAELVARAEELVAARSRFQEAPEAGDLTLLDTVTVGQLRRNLGGSGQLFRQIDERIAGYTGGTTVEWVEVAELVEGPAPDATADATDAPGPVDDDGLATEATAVVVICEDNSAVEAVGDDGEVLEGVADFADHSVVAYRFVRVVNPADRGAEGDTRWYAVEPQPAPDVERTCP